MHDLVIKGGTVVDGTGAPAYDADVAVDDGVITEIGRVDVPGRETIDATGRIVTPGFVDVHTHYDGQATWDPLLSPSSSHGVTTVIMGNCGVGFAPVRPDRHDWLIELMEGVEDIPGAALSAGIAWGWETFPEYLDALDRHSFAIDVGAQVPHGAVRGYVMGARGADNEPATPDDIAAMADIVREAVAAGALGVSTSRTIVHRAVDGRPVPGTFAAEAEVFALGEALAASGRGVLQLAPAGVVGEDLLAPPQEVEWMRRLAEATGLPITFVLTQHDAKPDQWRQLLDLAMEANAAGIPLRPQVAGRPTGILHGLQTLHPLRTRPAYRALAHLELPELTARLRDPRVKQEILSQHNMREPSMTWLGFGLDRVFPLGDPPDYEPAREDSVAAQAAQAGRDPVEYFYDQLLEDDGRALLLRPLLGFSDFSHDALREMLAEPATVWGLGDGGAHVAAVCDASTPTSMLTHWTRDRTRGPRLPLELVVRKMTSDTAGLYGLDDRGRVAVGKKADLNVIDLQRLRLQPPYVGYDLPGGARRLLQLAEGYDATVVSGAVVMKDGRDTGARPGRLLRS